MIIIENPITTKFDNTPLFRNDEAVTKSNRILKWFPMDSEELFNNNLKKEPKNKSLLYYLDNPITYKLNEYGLYKMQSDKSQGLKIKLKTEKEIFEFLKIPYVKPENRVSYYKFPKV